METIRTCHVTEVMIKIPVIRRTALCATYTVAKGRSKSKVLKSDDACNYTIKFEILVFEIHIQFEFPSLI